MPLRSKDSRVEERIVRIEPGYQHFSRDFDQVYILKTIRNKELNNRLKPHMHGMLATVHHPHIMNGLHYWTELDLLEILFSAPEISLSTVLSSPADFPTITAWLLDSWLTEMEGLASAVEYLEQFSDPKKVELSLESPCPEIQPGKIFVMRSSTGQFTLQLGDSQSGTLQGVAEARGSSGIRQPDQVRDWYHRHRADITWPLGCVMLGIVLFSSLTSDPTPTLDAGNGPSSGKTEKQILKDDVVPKTFTMAPASVVEMFRGWFAADKDVHQKPTLNRLIDLIAQMIEDGRPEKITMEQVCQTLQEISQNKTDQDRTSQLRSFVAASRCARLTAAGNNADLEDAMETAELLLGQKARPLNISPVEAKLSH